MITKQIKNSPRAFSLVEAILSIFLVSVGLLACISLVASGLRQSMDSRDQTVAALLAQEGVELVRNIRDNNWADGDPATDSFTNFPVPPRTICIIDKNYTSGALTCGAATDTHLYQNSNGYYTHNSGGIATKFSRRISVYDAGNGNRKIISRVIWGTDFPSLDPNDLSNCNTASQCAYTEAVLTLWGSDNSN